MRFFAVLPLVLLLVGPVVTVAQVPDVNSPEFTNMASEFNLGTNTDFKQVIINLVKVILGFLGLLSVIIVLYGGFRWMTALGNEERVSLARGTLSSGLVGLIIILSSYALTAYILKTFVEVTS